MQPIKNDGYDDYNLENAYYILSEKGRPQNGMCIMVTTIKF